MKMANYDFLLKALKIFYRNFNFFLKILNFDENRDNEKAVKHFFSI